MLPVDKRTWPNRFLRAIISPPATLSRVLRFAPHPYGTAPLRYAALDRGPASGEDAPQYKAVRHSLFAGTFSLTREGQLQKGLKVGTVGAILYMMSDGNASREWSVWASRRRLWEAPCEQARDVIWLPRRIFSSGTANRAEPESVVDTSPKNPCPPF